MFDQVEFRGKNNCFHYQLWVSIKFQVLKTSMVRELRKKFYHNKMIDYYEKELKANLNNYN